MFDRSSMWGLMVILSFLHMRKDRVSCSSATCGWQSFVEAFNKTIITIRSATIIKNRNKITIFFLSRYLWTFGLPSSTPKCKIKLDLREFLNLWSIIIAIYDKTPSFWKPEQSQIIKSSMKVWILVSESKFGLVHECLL